MAGVTPTIFGFCWASSSRVCPKTSWYVPRGDVLLGRGVAVPLLGVQVQQLRTAHVLDLPEYAHQFLDVMSVEGAEVAYVHALEDVLLMRDGTLQRVRESDESLAAVVVHHALAVQPALGLEAYGVVGLVGVESQQVLLHAAYASVYRHVVVVEDNQQVVGRRRGVVQSFKGQSARHGSVADDGHHLSVLVGHRHAQSCRYGVGGMAAGERVVLALFGRGERSDAAQLAVRREPFAAARQYLVAVSLVAYVPYDAVFGRIINIV